MRRPVAVVVTLALLLAGITPPTGGVHTDEDPLHGELEAPPLVNASFFLHCQDSFGDPLGRECAAGGARNFQAAPLQDGDDATDPVGSPGSSDETALNYSFIRSRDGEETPTAHGEIEKVTPILFIDNQNPLNSDFHVEFWVNGSEVDRSETVQIDATSGTVEKRFPIVFDNTLNIGKTTEDIKIRIVGQGQWVLHLHDPHVPSRVEFTGQLLRTRSWLAPPDGGIRHTFNVNGSEDARSFRPLMSVRPALGAGMVWPVNDALLHNHTGGMRDTDPPRPDAELHYDPLDPGIGPDNPVSDSSCSDPTEIEHDEQNSSVTHPILHVDRGGEAVFAPCTIDANSDLAGNWSFDFQLKSSVENNTNDDEVDPDGSPGEHIPLLECNGIEICTDGVDVELIEETAFGLSLDRDDDLKEVLTDESVHYNLRLENRMASELTFDLEIQGPDRDNWTAELDNDQVTLSSGQSIGLDLTVTPSSSASPNDDATTTVVASVPDFEETRDVAVTTLVAGTPSYGADIQDTEASAGPGERATFLVEVTNTGNTRDTFQLSAIGVPASFDLSMQRSTLTLDAGERDQVRIHVDVPEDPDDRFLDDTVAMALEAQSTSADAVVGDGALALHVQASYGYDAEVFHPTHVVRTANGTAPPGGPDDDDAVCRDAVGNTTYGSWYRVDVENTGGKQDTIQITDLQISDTEGEDEDAWEIRAFPRPFQTPKRSEDTEEFTLPSGSSRMEFYILVNRTDRNLDDDEFHDQCDPTGDAWENGNSISADVTLRSTGQPGLKANLDLRLEAIDNAFRPGVEVEKTFFTANGSELGARPVAEIREPRAVPPGETQRLTFRYTNTGDHACLRHGGNAYRAFFTGLPWTTEANKTHLAGDLGGLQTGEGTGTPFGDDDGSLSVTYNDTIVEMNVTVDARAEAGETFHGTFHVDAVCDIPNTAFSDGVYDSKTASDSVPIDFVVTEKEGLNVSTLPSDGEIEVVPGEEAMVNVAVNNNGSTRPTYNLSLAGTSLPSGWQVRFAGLDSLAVPPLSTAYVPVAIEAPASAPPDQVGSVDVKVTSTTSDLEQTVEVRARTVGNENLSMTPQSKIKAVSSGGTVQYNVTVSNLRDENITIQSEDLAIRGLPDDWQGHVIFPDNGSRVSVANRINVTGGDEVSLGMEITAAREELAVSTVASTLVASTQDETVAATVQTTIADEFGVDLSATPANLAVRSGDTARYKLRVTSDANGIDTIDLDHETPPPGWTVQIPQDDQRLVLGALETTTVPVEITTPADAPPGLTVPIDISAASVTRPSETDTQTLTTTVASYDPKIRADAEPRRVGPGQSTNFPVTVLNEGTGTDTIELSASAKPKGWDVEFSRAPVDLAGGESRNLTVKITPSPTATARSENLIVVQADSTFAPEKSDSVTFEVSIADYLDRDVDGDGIREAAVDTDDNIANGYERFQETDRRRGIVSSEVAAFDGDGDDEPDFLIDTTGDDAPDVYWSPVGQVFTQTTALDVDGDGVEDHLADGDGDEIVDAIYLPPQDIVTDATGLDVDGDLEPEYLVDTTGDGRLDRYADSGDPRPGYMVRTATAVVSQTSYAVDTDGDGSHDTVVDVQDRTTRSFTLADAATQLLTSYWYAPVLFAIVIVLFGAIRLASPKRRYVYDDYDD